MDGSLADVTFPRGQCLVHASPRASILDPWWIQHALSTRYLLALGPPTGLLSRPWDAGLLQTAGMLADLFSSAALLDAAWRFGRVPTVESISVIRS